MIERHYLEDVHIVWRDERDGNYEIYYNRNPTGNVTDDSCYANGVFHPVRVSDPGVDAVWSGRCPDLKYLTLSASHRC